MVRATDLKPLDELPGRRANVWTSPSRSRSPEVFEGCDLIVLSPDVPADLRAARSGAPPRRAR